MEKEVLYRTIEEKAPLLTALSDHIWEYAELSMREVRSTAEYVALLRQEGFTVEENLCGIPTAFSGRYGTQRPVIGILGEYDALSGLSQEAGALEHKPLTPGGCGQGCGHNLLGAGSLGAAIAIKEAIASGQLEGSVVFYGCPGEEGCAGKTFMARDGMFRDLDAAITWHPGDTNEVTTGSNAACLQYVYSFTGVAAHAAGNPFHGRSALDAAELMNVGVQFLREHIRPGESVHYSFLDTGGPSPNVVQPTAQVLYMVRSHNVTEAKALLARVHNIARGAALMTDTQVQWHQIDGTASTLSNTVLEQLLQEQMEQAPLPEYSQEEIDFAAKVFATYPNGGLPGNGQKIHRETREFVKKVTENGTKPLNNFIMPYVPSEAFEPGSTDVGDVSWLTPTAQFTAVTWPSNAPGHSWQNVSMGKTSIARKGMCYAGKVLAGAAAELMENAALLAQVKAEFAETAAAGYDCPLEPDVVATPAV